MPETDLSQIPLDTPGSHMNTSLQDFADEPAASHVASAFRRPPSPPGDDEATHVGSAFRRTGVPLDGDEDASDAGEDEEPPPARRREGLPPSFRMRHQPHYVEQLIGGAPIQTVRQIPIGDVHGEARPGTDLSALAESIRRFGMLQPLVVSERRDAGGYRVIAGVNRLSAARLAEVPTVPALVIEADDDLMAALACSVAPTAGEAEALREPEPEAASRAGSGTDLTARPEPAAAPEPPPVLTDLPGMAAFREMSRLAAGLAAIAPLAAEADADGFRGPVMRDLIIAEADRAATFAAAAAILAEPQAPRLQAVDCAEVLGRVREKVERGARLKGVAVDWPAPAPMPATGDVASLVTAWSALVYAQLAAAGAGDRIVITLEATRVRPAVVFTATLHHEREAVEARAAGVAAEVMIRASEHAARQHGGRAGLEPSGEGLRAVFVIACQL